MWFWMFSSTVLSNKYCNSCSFLLLMCIHYISYIFAFNSFVYLGSYLDKFTAIPGKTPSLTSSQNMVVGSDEACAQKCINSPTCRSFQYCMVTQTCSLLQTHHFSIKNNNSNTNTFCTFYSSK